MVRHGRGDARPRAGRRPVARVARGLLAASLLTCPVLAGAFPDGAPWEAAGAEGCAQCHFDAPAVENSEALTLEGLPERAFPGRSYLLTVRLRAKEMAAAGFLLSAWQGDAGAGRFSSAGPGSEARGARVRSTGAAAAPRPPGVAEWTVKWTAPAMTSEPHALIVVELWANAANGDRSPFGDTTHRRVWRLPLEPADESRAAGR